ncbi:MAG: NAD-dependent epimerase/dehydratase family protein [Desulfobacteraceae bacterium]|jgi:UDP-glucose 4-epimerase
MKILVTGGAGFIGSNVVDGYLAEGHEVVVVDDLSSGRRENVAPEAVFYKEDVRSPEMDRILKTERPDVLNHHAAQMSVPVSVADPVLDADINLCGFLNLLEGAVRHHVKKVIFISSGGAIYGDASEYPTSEACQPQPLSPYAVSKYASEIYLAYYRHQHGLESTVLRYANIYGPRQIPHGEAGVVAIFMDHLLSKKPSVLNHFPDDERGMIRDYTYVGDVVRANIAALERGSGEVVNIGTGQETRTLDLYQTIFQAVHEKMPSLPDALSELARSPARAGDIPRSCLRVEKSRSVLGWRFEIPLDEGIRRTLAWRMGQSY